MTGSQWKLLCGPIEECQGCASSDLSRIISFGHQPPVHSLLTAAQLREAETYYPNDLLRCARCGLIQLGYAVDPTILFPREYPYQSGMTDVLRQNFGQLAEAAARRFHLTSAHLVVDIGSNDGTLLQGFRARGMRVLGVEPTAVAEIAERNGIPTVNDFFSEKVAGRIVDKHGRAKIVTAANVFAHVNDLASVIRGIDHLLLEDGVFISESHYLLDLVQGIQYDTVYHEHLRFYHLKPLIGLLERFGFRVIDAERIAPHGGSIRVYAVKNGSATPSDRLRALLNLEEKSGLNEASTFEAFRERVVRAKHRLLALLLQIREEGGRIVGVGAPARASMLLNYCRIGDDLVDYIVERRGSLKIGLSMPGSHIPVGEDERMLVEQPPYALLLSWHIGDELVNKLRQKGFRGRFIIPLPEPRIVE